MWMGGESSRLSLTVAGSSTKTAFGAESAGGAGRPESDVTQSGWGPAAFAAVQPAGSAGGVTPSKLSANAVAAPAPTATDADACPEPSPEAVKDAGLSSVEPQVNSVVPLITWACVVAPPARVVWLYASVSFGGEPSTDQPGSLPPASIDQSIPWPPGRASVTARPWASAPPVLLSVTV